MSIAETKRLIRELDEIVSSAKKAKLQAKEKTLALKIKIERLGAKLIKEKKKNNIEKIKNIEILIACLQESLVSESQNLLKLDGEFGEDFFKEIASKRKIQELKLKDDSLKLYESRGEGFGDAQKLKKVDFFNQERLNYVVKTENILDLVEQLLSDRDASHEKFYSFSKNFLDEFSSVSAVDVKAAAVNGMLLDFFGSYVRTFRRNKNFLEDVDVLKGRLKVAVEDCYCQMNVVDGKNKFSLNECYVDVGNYIELNALPVKEQVHVIDTSENAFFEGKLYEWLLSKLIELADEKIITESECSQIVNSTFKDVIERSERIYEFDEDEYENSVQNIINSMKWFFKKSGSVPASYKESLLSCYSIVVKRVEFSSIPNNHDFYKLISLNDRLNLYRILQDLVVLNNRYEGVIFRVALSIISKSEESYLIKKKMYDFAMSLAHDYFYGIFYDDLSAVKVRLHKYLNGFSSYLSCFSRSVVGANLLVDYVFLFFESVEWHLNNFCSYGGVPVVERGAIYTVRDRGRLSAAELVGSQTARDESHAKKMINEYSFSTLSQCLDLRFEKGFPKLETLKSYSDTIGFFANDLREMRRLLIKNYNPAESIIELKVPSANVDLKELGNFTGKFYCLWQWETTGDSLGRICLSYDYDQILAQTKYESRRDAKYDYIYRVNWNGEISPLDAPWLTSSKMGLVWVDSTRDLNLYIIQSFHDLFYSWYVDAAAKIKTSSLIKQNEIVYDEEDSQNIQINEMLHSYRSETSDLEQNQLDGDISPRLKSYFNKGMRSVVFFKILQEKFDVVVSQGKGSEMKVSRIKEGGRIYRLGHHGKDVVYNANLIRKTLKRLNISLIEWDAAFI